MNQYRDAEELLERAHDLAAAGDRDQARDLLQEGIASRVCGYSEAFIPLALLLEHAGESEAAIEVYRLAIDTCEPAEAAQAAVNLGCFLRFDCQDLAAAKRAFEKALTFGNDDCSAAAENNIAAIARLEGDSVTAATRFRHVIASEHPSHSPWAMLQLAGLLEDEARLSQAIKWYSAALRTLHPFVVTEARAALARLRRRA